MLGLRTASWATIVVLLCAGAASAEVRYTLTDLGTPGDGEFYDAAINDLGQVVSWGNGLFNRSGWIWDSVSGFTELTYSGGSYYKIFPKGINDAGVVVGKILLDEWSSGVPFVWDPVNGTQLISPLSSVPGGSVEGLGEATAVNDSGVVVGKCETVADADLWYTAFRSQMAGAPTELIPIPFDFEPNESWNELATRGRAYGINNAGQMVGVVGDLPDYWDWHPSRACLWDAQGNASDIGSIGGLHSAALDINDAGQVVGWTETSELVEEDNFAERAFVWTTANGFTDLGALVGPTDMSSHLSTANAINNDGWAAGWALTTDPDNDHAVLWDESGQIMDLNELVVLPEGWVLNEAYDINDAGQIVGTARGPGEYEHHLFLLNPVPEPAGAVVLAFGCLAVLGDGDSRAVDALAKSLII